MSEREDKQNRGWRFWLVFLALCISLFLTALDLASVSTALPAIVHDLGGSESFAWVSSAYTLACTAVLPISGRAADIFGRRTVLLVAIMLFAAGSAVTGAAASMNMMIAGRTIQGIGSGAIQVLVSIVTADLIPLKERGLFQSFTGATFSLASVIGPFIGGAIAQHTSWRWYSLLIDLNLPLCVIAFVLVLVFLRLRKPHIESYAEAFLTLDWVGNLMIIGGATSCIVALTWAGVSFPWSSAPVIAPLAIGLVCLPMALVYEALLATHAVIPLAIVNNRTSASGYIGSFLHGLVVNSVPSDCMYSPTYFQGAKAASPLRSGLYILPAALFLSPSAIVQGIVISKTGRYRLVNIIGWCAMLLGMGLLTLLKESTPVAVTIPMQIIVAVGFGFLYATTFSVLAPLDPVNNSAALSLLLFVRTFSASWGISISATILQNQLQHHLPDAFLQLVPPNHDIAYSSIPIIQTLPQPLQTEVREAFASSLKLVWQVLLAFCGAGLLSATMQKQIALHDKMDDRWGLEQVTKEKDSEMPPVVAGEVVGTVESTVGVDITRMQA
ncbi:MFS general substrate transporter [Dichomitus squalens]|uniref:MFS general substrate transporter n=1 Tax=Dichomitus squalens TaxID=114155 RepID=A0A4Q9M855_9APHY|nr:MFS general substrate transporter [Dichomitus squalens]